MDLIGTTPIRLSVFTRIQLDTLDMGSVGHLISVQRAWFDT